MLSYQRIKIIIYLFITHTHSEHIGILESLQQYLYWVCGKKLNIVYDSNVEYLDDRFLSFSQVRYIKSSHGTVPFSSASLIFKTENGNIFYSGDIEDSEVITTFISLSDEIDKMYIDSSYNKMPVHLHIYDLNEVIPSYLKSKVFCMHINNKDILPLIDKYGFNVVKVDGSFMNERNIESMTSEELDNLEKNLEKRLLQVKKAKQDKYINLIKYVV